MIKLEPLLLQLQLETTSLVCKYCGKPATRRVKFGSNSSIFTCLGYSGDCGEKGTVEAQKLNRKNGHNYLIFTYFYDPNWLL